MIRYRCFKCGAFIRGGAEDKKCPLCDGSLVFVKVIK